MGNDNNWDNITKKSCPEDNHVFGEIVYTHSRVNIAPAEEEPEREGEAEREEEEEEQGEVENPYMMGEKN